jgi:hypothetical protein
MDDAPGYAKATFQGPQGSGKSRTATELAIRIRELFSPKKPIAFFDTEAGSDYLEALITKRTGMRPLRAKRRAFSDLMTVVDECLAGAADVLLVDSITHVWRELQDAHMAAVNARLKYPKTRMDVGDVMAIKKTWEPWPNIFLTSPLHIIVCGREGNEWGNEEDEETGKRELVAVGKKMKVESEFGYEASLQVAMSIVQVPERVVRKKAESGQKKSAATRERQPRRIINVATVLKDRFDAMNGTMIEMPAGKDFDSFLKLLKPALHGAVDTTIRSDRDIDIDDSGFNREKRSRTRWAEEIQGLLVKHHPGQTAADKQAKGELLFKAFASRSWSYIETLDSKRLYDGFRLLKNELEPEAEVSDYVLPDAVTLADDEGEEEAVAV